jgi:hypothetical protein
MRTLVFCIDKETMMHRRMVFRLGVTALFASACALPTERLAGPGLVFVYTDN